MFGDKKRLIQGLVDELSDAYKQRDDAIHQLHALEATRIRYSVPTDLGVRPIYDMPLIFGILQSKLMPNKGYDMPAGTLEIVSAYISPVLIYEEPDDNVD
jgi:hypothetical protein